MATPCLSFSTASAGYPWSVWMFPCWNLWSHGIRSSPYGSGTAIAPRARLVPVVGTVLIAEQPEYGDRAHQGKANSAIERLLKAREVAVVPIDTCLDPPNRTGLRTPAEIESLIARMDVVVTTRLHGTALALKNGVPPLVIDSVAGGDKVIRHARTLGWPASFVIDELTDAKLMKAFDYCLTSEARQAAADCGNQARQAVEQVRREFIAEVARNSGGEIR